MVDGDHAEDGYVISCRQWKCLPRSLHGDKQLNPVLLLNGYSTESFWLPTEPTDLVRTLLEEGHETWLLQPRLHPINPANNFTIDEIGRFDIPAGKRIKQMNPSELIFIPFLLSQHFLISYFCSTCYDP